MKSHSLTRRVLLVVLLVELLCAGSFSAIALWHEWRTRMHAVDALLQGRSDSLLGAVQDAEDPADNVFVDPVELRLPADDRFSVYNQAGALLGGTEQSALPLTQRAGVGFRSVSFNGSSYRVLEREALRIIDRPETGGVGLRRPVTIVYAIPTTHLWHEILPAAGFYAVASLGLASGTALMLLVLIRRLLHPVEELAASAAEVSPASLTFTAPPSAARVQELQPLVRALDATVASLRVAFDKQHRFVSDAAHELKTAVAVVRSSIQVLHLKPRSAEEYRLGLEHVLADNERVEDLVARMLLLAHAEEAPPPQDALSDLSLVVRETLGGLKSYAAARHVALGTSLQPQVWVRLPATALRTVVSNLVVNAIQHSPESSEVNVRVIQSLDAGDEARLEVEDHGKGIDASDLPLIFDRFYRADASRSRETGGAGLGLAICKSFVESAHGRIEVRSVPGQGTCVCVHLPAVNLLTPVTQGDSLTRVNAS